MSKSTVVLEPLASVPLSTIDPAFVVQVRSLVRADGVPNTQLIILWLVFTQEYESVFGSDVMLVETCRTS